MAFYVSGTAYVPRHEFEEWFRQNANGDTGNMSALDYATMRFDDDNSLLVDDSNAEVWDIMREAFCDFVYGFMRELRPAEWEYGIPRVSGYDIEVDFCSSDGANLKDIEHDAFKAVLNGLANYQPETPFEKL